MTWLGRGIVLGLLAFIVLGPLANLVLWAAAEQWYFPHKLPVSYGTKFWEQVFKPRGDALASLVTSIWIALATVGACLALAVPAGYALARLKLPWRTAILLAFLLPQAFPSVAVYINIARIFYDIKLNGTMIGVILVHTVHGLVFAVWITAAAFAAVDRDLELAARGIMASAIFVFLESLDEFTGTFFVGVPDVITLPLLMFTASIAGNYQIAAITALVLLVPSVVFMLVIERFLKADVLSRIGA
jgi:ABC-type spermidine/putrescine transport system permease subunit II